MAVILLVKHGCLGIMDPDVLLVETGAPGVRAALSGTEGPGEVT